MCVYMYMGSNASDCVFEIGNGQICGPCDSYSLHLLSSSFCQLLPILYVCCVYVVCNDILPLSPLGLHHTCAQKVQSFGQVDVYGSSLAHMQYAHSTYTCICTCMCVGTFADKSRHKQDEPEVVVYLESKVV